MPTIEVQENTMVTLRNELCSRMGRQSERGRFGTALCALRGLEISLGQRTIDLRPGSVELAAPHRPRRWAHKVIAPISASSARSRPKASAAMPDRSPLERSVSNAIKGFTPRQRRYAGSGARPPRASNPDGAALERDPLAQVWGTMLLSATGGRVHIDVSPPSVAPGINAGGVMDLLQHHSGDLRALLGRERP